MNNKETNIKENIIQKRKRRSIWKKVVSVLACVVVFCTTYALILPAITMSKETYCGLEEHVHTDICYENKLICQMETKLEESSEEGREENGEESEETSGEDSEENGEESEETSGEDSEENGKESYGESGEESGESEFSETIHIHTEECYEKILICKQEEHEHTTICFSDKTAEDEQIPGDDELAENLLLAQSIDHEQVQHVIQLIDELPAAHEIESRLGEYEQLDDMEAYEHYYEEIYYKVLAAYVQYEDLSDELRAEVTNRDKLMELEWLWSAKTMSVIEDVPVYQINSFDINGSGATYAVLFAGKSADDYGCNFGFSWWSAIVVDEKENGDLYVSEIITTGDVDKSAYGPSTENGFVLYIWHSVISIADLGVKVGDLAVVPFDYTVTTTYTGTSLGSVKFVEDTSSELTIVKGEDTNEWIEVNLYDYNGNINTLYNENEKYPGFQQDEGTITNVTYFGPSSFNFGNNITSDLAAGQSGVTVVNGNTINATAGKNTAYGTANIPIDGVMSLTLKDGYPALADGTSLGYLFQTNTYSTKRNKDSINGLFLYDETTGAYSYNSRENHVQFNVEDDTFTLYEQLISSNFMMYPFGNFLPFNDIVKQCRQTSRIDRDYFELMKLSADNKYDAGMGEEYGTLAARLTQFISLMDQEFGTDWTGADAINKYFEISNIPKTFEQNDKLLQQLYSIDYDEATDFYFGMEITMDFVQPKGGMIGKDRNQDGNPDYPMEFYFTGDDDVWIYIDGVLFLDLSGIHRHVGGTIDFVNGLVHYYYLDVATGEVSTTPYKTVTFEEILTEAGKSTEGLNEKGTFTDHSSHSFNFYYIERGAGSGVCRMNFNFPLLNKNSVSVAKELSVDDETILPLLGNPDFKFQILKADSDGNKTEELFIGPNVSYAIYDGENQKIGDGITDKNGVFCLKAGQRAEFVNIDKGAGKYYVRELLDTEHFEQYKDVAVNGNSVTSTEDDIIIDVDTFKGLESLVKDVSDGSTAFVFNNEVSSANLGKLAISKILSGETVSDTMTEFEFYVTIDGEPVPVGTRYVVDETEKIVETAGMIRVPAGSTAVISKILAGSQFAVSETNASSDGYTVTYMGSDGVTTDGTRALGVIKVNSSVQVHVTNSEKGVTLSVPGIKTVKNPDGQARMVTFRLEEVTDASGSEKVEEGTELTTDVLVDQTADFEFPLIYSEKKIESFPALFYYKITEIENSNTADLFIKDDVFYVIEVTVSKGEGDAVTAAVTNQWKDGETVSDEIIFQNILLSDLSLKKIVTGIETAEEFVFEIELKDSDGQPITGTFEVNASDQTIETLQFDAEGKAKIRLKHEESIRIMGIPNDSWWKITELTGEGFTTTYNIEGTEELDGKTGEGFVNNNSNEIIFTNSTTYMLPETGGMGTAGYITGGIIMMILACVFLYLQAYRFLW